jgi:ABC-2 type transport system ATP-binding protein
MIEVNGVTKHFGGTAAAQEVTFSAPSGMVTGFLGPNGAGKTTTLRVLLGLARPDAGEALIDGVPYAELAAPRRTVGAVIDAMAAHPGRTGRNHLRVVARAAGIPAKRDVQVLDDVELGGAAVPRAGGYSIGKRQRLALATALLGDPPVLVLDEPSNGLDPAGIAWLRELLGNWAAQGRTVLFSSHALGEVESVADRVVIIDRGRVVREATTADIYGTERGVVVRTADSARFAKVASDAGWRVRRDGRDRLIIHGSAANEVGAAAARAGVALAELSSDTSTNQLEELFFELTGSNGNGKVES